MTAFNVGVAVGVSFLDRRDGLPSAGYTDLRYLWEVVVAARDVAADAARGDAAARALTVPLQRLVEETSPRVQFVRQARDQRNRAAQGVLAEPEEVLAARHARIMEQAEVVRAQVAHHAEVALAAAWMIADTNRPDPLPPRVMWADASNPVEDITDALHRWMD